MLSQLVCEWLNRNKKAIYKKDTLQVENVEDREKRKNVHICFAKKILAWHLTNSLEFNFFAFTKPQWKSVERMRNPPVILNKKKFMKKEVQQKYSWPCYKSHVSFSAKIRNTIILYNEVIQYKYCITA